LATPLARLRYNLDFLPSPSEEHPGLFIRDPFHYSDAMLVIPPGLVDALRCFDGEHTELDLRAELVRLSGSLEVGEMQQQLIDALSGAGFLEDEQFAALRDERQQEFAAAPVCTASHAGSAYPDQPDELREVFRERLSAGPPPAANGNLLAIAAPHVSPDGGWDSYRAAYGALGPEHRDRTFVILGTSHYGEPERFGLTRKNFATPLGEAVTDVALVDRLEAAMNAGGPAAKAAIEVEDYCFSFEHTVEFQVVFLQHVFGPQVRILPVLCGQFARSLYHGGMPEQDEGVKAFLEALGEIGEQEAGRLLWVLGVDMAHMGRRYGDGFEAIANEGVMERVAQRDRGRIECIRGGDAAGFWEQVRENQDDLKWCGSAPFYTFLKSAPKSRGELLHYEQWNIDEQSVVSFAGLSFSR
jgi:MEMO1 family protein